jgi:hypothetical protein
LLASAFAAVAEGTVAVLSPSGLVVASFSGGEDVETFVSELGTQLPGMGPTLALRALPGTSRSRVLDFLPGDGSVTPAALAPTFPLNLNVSFLAESLLLPVRPSFTATNLAGKIDSYFQDRETPAPFLMVIDQINGTLAVFALGSGGNPIADYSSAQIAGVVDAVGGGVIVAYDLTVPDPAAPVDATVGPVWG